MDKPKLLVIDDETGVLEMIRSHFELRGLEVHTASDGAEGIELAGRIQPDLIVLDLKMKNWTGTRPFLHSGVWPRLR